MQGAVLTLGASHGKRMEIFRVQKEEVPERGVVVLHVQGPLNPNTVGSFSEALQDLFDRSIYKVVLDLVNVDYISSAGVGALISARTTAQDNQGDIVLIHPNPKILELFGLIDLFHFAADVPAATALF